MDLGDIIAGEVIEVGVFRDVLPDEFVGIFDGSFLPRGIGVGEKDGSLEDHGDKMVGSEFESVISGDRADVISIGKEEGDGGTSSIFRREAVLDLLNEAHVGGALHDGEDGRLSSFSDDGIHLKVSKSEAVSFGGSVVNADSVGDMLGRGIFVNTSASVLQLMPAMRIEGSTLLLVLTDPLVNGLMGDVVSLLLEPAGDLHRGPLLID